MRLAKLSLLVQQVLHGVPTLLHGLPSRRHGGSRHALGPLLRHQLPELTHDNLCPQTRLGGLRRRQLSCEVGTAR
jgi:hypothetical protein